MSGGALKIGQGQKAKAGEEDKAGSVTNPKYTAGAAGKVWKDDQIEEMGAIMGTMTTFNPPSQAFTLTPNVDAWEIPQHFPDKGAPGWR